MTRILGYDFESHKHVLDRQPTEPAPDKKVLVIAQNYDQFTAYYQARQDRRPRYVFRFWEAIGRTPEHCEVVFLGWPKDADAASDIEDYLLANGWEW